jgi:hypothetical protein
MCIVVVNLVKDAETGRAARTGRVQVKSNKRESAMVFASIGADESALTETHVGLE